MFIYQTAAIERHVQRLSTLAYLAFALVLVAEVMGRFLFYVSMVKIGL
jgi:DMSO reductase anchor subunit